MKKFIVCLIVAITLSNCEIKVKTSNAQISRVTEEEWIKTSESTGVFVKRLNIDNMEMLVFISEGSNNRGTPFVLNLTKEKLQIEVFKKQLGLIK
jgi:hypothetical protein